MKLFHICSDSRLLGKPTYVPESFVTEEFIHLCKPGQLKGVYDRYYANQEGLTLLLVEIEEDDELLEFEDSYEVGELFPHYYNSIAEHQILLKKNLSSKAADVYSEIEDITQDYL